MSETAAPAPAAAAPASSAAANTTAPTTPPDRGSPGTPSKAPQGSDPSAQPAKSSSAPELFDVKVDGKIVKMTRDELIQHASMGHAADRRFKEAAAMRKQAEAVIGKLRDPKSVITALQDPALGLTKEQIREQFEEWYAREFIEPEQLTPEQRKLREAEERLKRYEEMEKQQEEQKRKEHLESLTAKAREEIQAQIMEALETSDLPKTNFTIRRLAYWMERNRANGFDAPTSLLVSQVKNEFNSTLRDMVAQSDGDVLIKILGDDVIQKLRKYDLEQLRKLRQQPAPQAQEPQVPQTQRDERPLTSADVTQRIRELQKTGRY